MELVYSYSESTVPPESIWIDITTVYLRKDIAETQREDENGTKTTFYTYQEATLTHDEFNKYTAWMTAKKAIYGEKDTDNIINIMAGQQITDEYQLATMEAIADLYDTIAAPMV